LNEESVKHHAHGERSGKWQQQLGPSGETEFFRGIHYPTSITASTTNARQGMADPRAGFS
jgi:hypothetical protein